MTGSLVWRCKRCATVYSVPTERDLVAVLTTPRDVAHIHDCAPGAYGIGELVGALQEPMTTAAFARHLEAK